MWVCFKMGLYMRDHRPTLGNDIVSGSQFAKLQQHAEEILAINLLLNELLPRGTEKHCRAANIRDGQLIIEVASAALKMKLNYERMQLLNQLRMKGFSKLIAIDIRINPELYKQEQYPNKKEKTKSREPISENAAGYLRLIADSASPRVKKRLERLADLAKKKNQ